MNFHISWQVVQGLANRGSCEAPIKKPLLLSYPYIAAKCAAQGMSRDTDAV